MSSVKYFMLSAMICVDLHALGSVNTCKEFHPDLSLATLSLFLQQEPHPSSSNIDTLKCSKDYQSMPEFRFPYIKDSRIAVHSTTLLSGLFHKFQEPPNVRLFKGHYISVQENVVCSTSSQVN